VLKELGMKSALISVIVILVAGSAGIGQGTETVKDEGLPPGVVAIVNGEPITKEFACGLVWDWQGPFVMRDIIDQALILQEAKKQGVSASDEEVNAEVEQIRGMMTGDTTLEQALAQQGRTMARLRREAELRVLVDKMVTARIEVAPEDLDGVRARQIVISVASEEEEEKAREQAIRVRERILAGEVFADVAKEVSLDPAAQQNGGDMGIVRKGMLRPEIEAALFSLKVGEVSSPIRSGMGYHILLVEEKVPASSLTDEERSRLTEERKAALSRREIPQWFQRLQQSATIRCVFDEMNSAPATGTGEAGE
jgi:foldase protein PrsA